MEIKQSQKELWIVSAVSVIAVLPLWLVPILPFQDFAVHCSTTQAIIHHSAYSTVYSFNNPFTHGWLYYLTTSPIALTANPVFANKLLLSIALAAFPIASFFYVGQCRGNKALAAAGAIICAYNCLIAMGFVPFTMSLSLAVAFAALILRSFEKAGRAKPILIIVAVICSLGTYYFHFFGFLILCALVIVPATIVFKGKIRISICSSTLLPGALMFAASQIIHNTPSQMGTLSLSNPLKKLFNLPEVLTLMTVHCLDDLIVVIAIAVSITGIIITSLDLKKTDKKPKTTALYTTTILLLAIYLFLPEYLENPRIVMGGSRVAPLILVCLLGLFPDKPRLHKPLLRSMLVLGMIAVFMAGTIIVLEGKDAQAIVAKISTIKRDKIAASLTIHAPQKGSLFKAYAGLHLPAYYQALGQGISLYSFYHQDSPVSLQRAFAEQIEDINRDIPTYLGKISKTADVIIGDFGDMPMFKQSLKSVGYHECESKGPQNWRYYTNSSAPCFEQAMPNAF